MSCRSGIIRKVRTARWDRFGRPSELPKYGLSGFPALWWFDADKAAQERKTVLKDSLRMAHSLAGMCSVSVSARWRAARFAPALADNAGEKLMAFRRSAN